MNNPDMRRFIRRYEITATYIAVIVTLVFLLLLIDSAKGVI